MLKDEYLHNIITNLGIAISPEDNSEIIVNNTIFHDKKNNVYVLSDEYNIFYQEYGTIIVDFQNTNFSNKDTFINFFNKYSLFGLENKRINKLFIDGHCSTANYENYMDKTFNKYRRILSGYQKDIRFILDYCIFNPDKRTANLSPFERLCILEYLPNTPSLLQENLMQTIHLSTISDIDSNTYDENYLIKSIQSGKHRTYSNILHIPNDIASLLNFELTEIVKDNIILRICNYCNKYFIAPNRHITYCDNIAPEYTNKTCRQVARNNKYTQSFQDDEALILYKKVYNNKAYKATRYKDISSYELNYNHFKTIGRKKLKKYKDKEISKEDFINWIKSQ